MSFTDFAYFNGSVRRDKAQESVMQTFVSFKSRLSKMPNQHLAKTPLNLSFCET